MSLYPDAADQAYMTRRIIDCCLREDIRGLVSQGRIAQLPEALSQYLAHEPRGNWLQIAHLGGEELWLPVVRAYPLQEWACTGDAWVVVAPHMTGVQRGYPLWLGHLSQGLDEESLELFAAYVQEADCATTHRTLCQQAYQLHAPGLDDVTALKDWSQRLLKIDQLASYLDHPFYPTARAKSGFDGEALARYAPEFSPRFDEIRRTSCMVQGARGPPRVPCNFIGATT